MNYFLLGVLLSVKGEWEVKKIPRFKACFTTCLQKNLFIKVGVWFGNKVKLLLVDRLNYETINYKIKLNLILKLKDAI